MLQLLNVNWYSVFYWLTVSDGLKHCLDSASNCFLFFTITSFIGLFILSFLRSDAISEERTKTEEEDNVNPEIRAFTKLIKPAKVFSYVFLVLTLITWSLWALVPTKKDFLIIIAGGAVGNFITSDSSSQKLPSDMTKYLHLYLNKEIDNLGDDFKKQILIKTPTLKESFLDKAKNLTKEQIIEMLANDSTYLKQ
jgi:hypothetical protein